MPAYAALHRTATAPHRDRSAALCPQPCGNTQKEPTLPTAHRAQQSPHGAQGMKAWALREKRLQQQAEHQGVLWAALNCGAMQDGPMNAPNPACNIQGSRLDLGFKDQGPPILHFPMCKTSRPLPFGGSAFGAPHHTTPHCTAPHHTAHHTPPQRTTADCSTPRHTTLDLLPHLRHTLASCACMSLPTSLYMPGCLSLTPPSNGHAHAYVSAMPRAPLPVPAPALRPSVPSFSTRSPNPVCLCVHWPMA